MCKKLDGYLNILLLRLWFSWIKKETWRGKEKRGNFSKWICFDCRMETSEWIIKAGNKINWNNLFSYCWACFMEKETIYHHIWHQSRIQNQSYYRARKGKILIRVNKAYWIYQGEKDDSHVKSHNSTNNNDN